MHLVSSISALPPYMDSFFFFLSKMPAHKKQEITVLRWMFYVGGLSRRVDRSAIELHARNSSGDSLSFWWVIFKLVHLGFCLGLRHFGGPVSKGLVW